ncbi:hypothetical protein LCGC14_0470440 [marine sediment metagenome]|uniref:Uncharacterized protein n=1 Tax=marine sediment metagenome TaxID=412755 RepID=A0A0F9SCB5_9ZZZZ
MLFIFSVISLAALLALVEMTILDWLLDDLAPWLFVPLFLMALAPAHWFMMP